MKLKQEHCVPIEIYICMASFAPKSKFSVFSSQCKEGAMNKQLH